MGRFSKNTQISNFMKIPSVGAELFHVDGRTDRPDEANIFYSVILRPRLTKCRDIMPFKISADHNPCISSSRTFF